LNVQVVGLGTIGLPTAVHVARFFDVIGYDISPEKLEKASRSIAVSRSLSNADVYIVAVNTGINGDNTLDMSAVFNVCKEIAQLQPNALVAIESTVAVGVCRQIAERFGLRRLVHCPHRYWSGDPVKYGVVQKRILGALNDDSLKAGLEFYSKLEIPVHEVSSLEVAELTKITENACRFVEIAFAESLAMTCSKFAVSFEEVKKACNTLKRPEHGYQIQILEANNGIGGHCLPKDTRYLLSSMRNELLEGAILTDKAYKLWKKGLREEEIENYA
jgi:nucleotide sugar dehydrogenase